VRKSRVPDESVDGTFWHKLDSLLGGTLRGRQPRSFGMFLTQVDIVPVPICLSVAPGRLLESSVVAETLFAWLRWVGHERGCRFAEQPPRSINRGEQRYQFVRHRQHRVVTRRQFDTAPTLDLLRQLMRRGNIGISRVDTSDVRSGHAISQRVL